MTGLDGVRVYARVLAMDAATLLLDYLVENASGGDVFVCNRLYGGRAPDGTYLVDPDVVYLEIEPGPRPNVTKGVPERGDDVNVEYPVHPAATFLRPGERFGEQVRIALPIVPVDAYHPVRAQPGGVPVPSRGLAVSIGWFARERLDAALVVEVNTTAGRLPLVKASPQGQSIARVDLDVSVPVLLPGPAAVLRWQCPRCGALNAGQQPACLRCGLPLPPSPGAGWRPGPF